MRRPTNPKVLPKHLSYVAQRNADLTLKVLQDHKLGSNVELKKGMLVILQVNLNLKKGLCNGSQGIIYGFAKADGTEFQNGPILGGEHKELQEGQVHAFVQRQSRCTRVWPRVRFHNGVKCIIYAACMVNTIGDAKDTLVYRTQIPLVPGWAMTIHKSQGMTMERLIVNLNKVFEEGQVYVALSRVKSLEGLQIEGNLDGVSANTKVIEFLRKNFGSGIFPQSEDDSDESQSKDGREIEDKFNDSAIDVQDADISEIRYSEQFSISDRDMEDLLREAAEDEESL